MNNVKIIFWHIPVSHRNIPVAQSNSSSIDPRILHLQIQSYVSSDREAALRLHNTFVWKAGVSIYVSNSASVNAMIVVP
jgi:hypothetical protein